MMKMETTTIITHNHTHSMPESEVKNIYAQNTYWVVHLPWETQGITSLQPQLLVGLRANKLEPQLKLLMKPTHSGIRKHFFRDLIKHLRAFLGGFMRLLGILIRSFGSL